MKAFYQGISYKFIDYSFSIRANTVYQTDFLFEDSLLLRLVQKTAVLLEPTLLSINSSARELFYQGQKSRKLFYQGQKVKNYYLKATIVENFFIMPTFVENFSIRARKEENFLIRATL
jgi:hypothetical protein